MRLIGCILIILCSIDLSGQVGTAYNRGAYSQSVGGVYNLIDDNSTQLNNFAIAALRESSGHVASINAMRRYGLSELSTYSIGYQTQLGDKSNFLSAEVHRYGFDLYNEQILMLGYARKLSSKLAIAAKLGYNSLNIEEYGNVGSPLIQVSLAGTFNDKFGYGVVIQNPVNIDIDDNTYLRSKLVFGLNYVSSPKLTLYAEVDKELEEPINYKLGLDYDLLSKLSIRAGFNTNQSTIGIGIGLDINSAIHMNVMSSYNAFLGISPGLSLISNF